MTKTNQQKVEKLFDTVSGIETPVDDVNNLLRSIYLIALNLDEDVSGPLMTLAAKAQDICQNIEEQRQECFQTLHGMVDFKSSGLKAV